MPTTGAPVMVGRRLREVRAWRGLSLRTVAELAGLSASYLSRIERGERPVDRRSTLEALANALRVAPSELTGQPYAPADPAQAAGHAAASPLRAVLRDIELGVPPEIAPRSLPELQADVASVFVLTDASDYGALAGIVPPLLRELHTAVAGGSAAARPLLAHVLHSAFYLAKDLGHGDLAWAVSGHLHAAAAALSEPEWVGLAQFVRALGAVGDGARARALAVSQRAADAFAPDEGPAGQVHGMLHLSAALHAAALNRNADSADHLAAAEETAARTGDGEFAGLHFGPRNVGVWSVALAVELGEGARVAELARGVDVASIPSPGRRAMFYADLGRGLARDRTTREQAVAALRTAEDTAPQLIRANFLVRETVTDLLGRARREAGGRELRGMAHRMGVAG